MEGRTQRRGIFARFPVACLVLALLAALVPGIASADQLEPCQNRPVAGDEGEVELGVGKSTRKQLTLNGIRTTLVDPARRLGGVPVYPVRTASESGGEVVADLAGGFTVSGKGRRPLKVLLTRLVRREGSVTRVEGRLDGRRATLFSISGEVVERNQETGQVQVKGGRASVSTEMANRLRKQAGLRTARKGMAWGPLYLTWDEQTPPSVAVPEEPTPFPRPTGAADLADATLTWRVRPSWVQYVASGRPPAAIRGTLPGDPEVLDGQPPLVYDFTFPFSSGWVEDGVGGVESAAVRGSGGVYFRYCGSSRIYKGINFIVHSPELEIEGDSARLIFRVEGTDATPFPNSRAVVVNLTPTAPESAGATTTWVGMPGSVPSGALGVFAGFYAAGAEFGSVTVTIERGAVG